ncbi:MAG TPA: TetR/AcrR family transcriptional regulator [Stellaceae bacterium]|nr:TetR/AcrR family transcriptional regulator [Stellaceae bacterium]
MTQPRPERTLGRPKDQEKRTAIIVAARELFMERGYDGVTMEAVAVAAGVAKMTVYGHFHDKDSLFEASVRETTDMVMAGLTGLQGVDGQLEASLIAFGRSFLGFMLSPKIASTCHALMGVLAKNPILARRFYAAGPGHVRETLCAIIAAAAERGDIAVGDAAQAAEDLISLWIGEMPLHLTLGLVDPPTSTEIDHRARHGTSVFLRAYRPGNPMAS